MRVCVQKAEVGPRAMYSCSFRIELLSVVLMFIRFCMRDVGFFLHIKWDGVGLGMFFSFLSVIVWFTKFSRPYRDLSVSSKECNKKFPLFLFLFGFSIGYIKI
jgi:hypothetical protein